MEPTDPVVELRRQVPQSSAWHSKPRLELVRRPLDSKKETRPGRVLKETLPERSVRQHATQRAFHIRLTHRSSSVRACSADIRPAQ